MKTILVIEDHQEIRENTVEILTNSGYTVVTASNGTEGVTNARTNKPDLILCDILMPELNGYDVLRLLKADPQTAAIPFIYVTATTEKGDVKMAMDMGASGYVQKPFDMVELLTAIHSCIGH